MKYYYISLVVVGLLIGTCHHIAPTAVKDIKELAKAGKAEAKWRNWVRYQREVVLGKTE